MVVVVVDDDDDDAPMGATSEKTLSSVSSSTKDMDFDDSCL